MAEGMPTMGEIRSAVDTLSRFVEWLERERRHGLGRLFSGLETHTEDSTAKTGGQGGFRATGTVEPPPTYAARIIAILESSGKAMKPSEIAAEYTQRKWPMPPGGDVGGSIRTSLMNLKKRGVIRSVSGGRYRPAENEGR